MTVGTKASCGPTKKVDLALHPVIYWSCASSRRLGAVGFENFDPFFRFSMQGLYFTAEGEYGGDKRLTETHTWGVSIFEKRYVRDMTW